MYVLGHVLLEFLIGAHSSHERLDEGVLVCIVRNVALRHEGPGRKGQSSS